ncbi:hypothetical protein GCM10009837_07230 [Streptomyces durmitorensis]|uniref:Uncharacterized protein n=1 Tax=Streptomyces durmitorensis TaxID=319947 RepID=A0ABY4PNF1_9ACTN|nr:hypothetical protein [Streptomyces durmitorensis]UQT54384.1 hypothetical protein M4V62_04375 [Streptomyces durmitorensis]
MARPELSASGRASVDVARELLVEAQGLDLSQRRDVVAMVGRLEAAVVSLLEVADGGEPEAAA